MYKNWSEINKLVGASPFMAMAFATLSSDTSHPAVQAIVAAFPQCFDPEKELGPVPLSVILEETRIEMIKIDMTFEGHLPVSSGITRRHSIPCQEFWYEGSDFDQEEDILPLPKHIPVTAKIGEVYEWNGAQFVVVENNNNYGVHTFWLVPAECILVDVKL